MQKKQDFKKPKISVIMSVWNVEEFLDEAIQSILNQTFKDFEFIIINDASSDNSLKIIQKNMKKDKRIILINNKKNKGLTINLINGIKRAKGKYIARIDGDDISLPKRLEIQYNFLEKNLDIFLVGGSAIVINEEGKRIGIFEKNDFSEKIIKKLESGKNPLIHPSVMYRNKGINYREKFAAAEDLDFYLRLITSRKKLINIPDFLIKYRLNENSLMATRLHRNNYYNELGRKFYFQRKIRGYDDYDKFSEKDYIEIKGKEKFKDPFISGRIYAGFQDNKMKQVRKDILFLFKNYNPSSKLWVVYFLSFIPYKITKFVKNIFD